MKKITEILKEKANFSSKVLMHVSDTPLISLPYIVRITRKLQPHYLIHTGDFVDELKTTHPLYEPKDYERALNRFVSRFRNLKVDNIFLVPGNHDDLRLLEKYKSEFKIIPEGSIIDIGDVSISVAHEYSNLKKIPEKKEKVFYLYGHNKQKDERGRFLNGFCSINIIFFDNLKVYRIPYPFFVNIVRGKDRLIKIGL